MSNAFSDTEIPPTPLRQARVSIQWTRKQLSQRCNELAIEDPTYKPVSESAIKDLEMGRTKPRQVTAKTLAKALTHEVEKLFPDGLDTPLRNPMGLTRVDPQRPKGGRPRKAR